MVSPSATPPLPDEILEQIFLRLGDAPADLARAAASCNTFRHLITARAFLRRIHAVHRRPLLGFVKSKGACEFVPAEAPYSSAPAARAVAQAADFFFSFLPGPVPAGGWRLRDIRDGLALLSTLFVLDAGYFPDIIVCDPLHRRYVQIPPIPDDLAAPVPSLEVKHLSLLLAPAGREEEEGEEGSSFRFRVVFIREPKECSATVFAFSSGGTGGIWRAATLELGVSVGMPEIVHGYVCWQTNFIGRLLMLDTREMDFFFVRFHIEGLQLIHRAFRFGESGITHAFRIGEAGEGRIGLFRISNWEYKLDIFSKEIRGSADAECRHDKTIPLPRGYQWWIQKLAGGYLFLNGRSRNWRTGSSDRQYYTLELKKFLLEKYVLTFQYRGSNLDFYTSFPPPLSLPCI